MSFLFYITEIYVNSTAQQAHRTESIIFVKQKSSDLRLMKILILLASREGFVINRFICFDISSMLFNLTNLEELNRHNIEATATH